MRSIFRNIFTFALCFTAASTIGISAEKNIQSTTKDAEPQISETQTENQYETDDFDFESSFLQLDEDALKEISEYFDFQEGDSEIAQQIIAYAKNYLGRPYVHGAKGPKAFDCSGFTSFVFKKFDINLSPASRVQATQGSKISKNDVRPGDLLFFSGRGGGSAVGHVAMVVDVNENGVIKFIHASCSKGISYATYPDGGYYSKRFLHARRVIQND